MAYIRKKALPVAFLLLACIFLALPLGQGKGQEQGENLPPLGEMHHQLESLDRAEKETLAELFLVLEDIKQQERELAALQERQEQVAEALAQAELDYEKAVSGYEGARATATEALRWLQKLGPVSYLDLIVGAASFSDFWQRLDTIILAVRGVERALGHLIRARETAVALKETLAANRDELARVVLEARDKLRQLEETRVELEASLAGLGDRRQEYERYLAELEDMWLQELIPYLKLAAAELLELMSSGGQEALEMDWQLTRGGLKGRLPFTVLNASLASSPILKGAQFSGSGGKLVFTVPERGLTLKGKLSLGEGGREGSFDVEEIWLWGMPISPTVLADYREETHFTLTVPSLVPGIRLREIKVADDALEMTVSF
ncbi:MAG TPA: hypothetical protein GX518_05165 [Firmicutes bacterium]|nr:hypothetical protein [Bacillota bacterium]